MFGSNIKLLDRGESARVAAAKADKHSARAAATLPPDWLCAVPRAPMDPGTTAKEKQPVPTIFIGSVSRNRDHLSKFGPSHVGAVVGGRPKPER